MSMIKKAKSNLDWYFFFCNIYFLLSQKQSSSEMTS
jgi:hypothetical protein